MKVKRIILGLLIVMMIAVPFSTRSYADNGPTTVHVTRTGSCYHKAGCSYLKSDITITLKEAYDCGYSPCSRCKPTQYSPSSSSTSSLSTRAINNTSNNPMEEVPTIIWVAVIGATSYAGVKSFKHYKERADKINLMSSNISEIAKGMSEEDLKKVLEYVDK